LLSRDTTRLLTLLGPPGIGKTRLSIAVAYEMLAKFMDGVFFVALAPISDEPLVPATIANVLGLQEVGPQTLLERLKTYLRDKQTLLVLDNFEQILPAATTIADLLTACPWLKILVTSRAPLHIRHERQFPVLPLALPESSRLPPIETLAGYAAIELFLERAQAVKPDFALTEDNAPTVAAICARLDGLPLAIELISARVKLLPPAALLERLHGRLMLQSDVLRDLEARHRTLNAAIDWSYHLLTLDEQILFRRLGVFVGGCTLEAIEAVCSPPTDVLDCVASLVDKSLLRQETDLNQEPRFTMLETLREYVLEKLMESGEEEASRRAHAEYFLALAERAEPELRRADQIYWLDYLENELDNLRVALNWSVKNEYVDLGLRLVSALAWFWVIHFRMVEGLEWAEKLLIHNPSPSLEKARSLYTVALLSSVLGDNTRGAVLEEEALPILRKFNDQPAIALSLIGVMRWVQGEYTQAEENFNEGLSLARQSGDKWQEAHLLYALSAFYHLTSSQQDLKRATELVNEGLGLARQVGDRYITNWLLNQASALAQQRGQLELCKALLAESLTLSEQLNDARMVANAQKGLGKIALLQHDYQRALVFYRKSLLWCVEMGLQGGIVENILGFAELALATAQIDRAARLFAAMQDYTNMFLVLPSDPSHFHTNIRILRSKMEEAAFAAAWAEGCTMTLEQAVAYVLEE